MLNGRKAGELLTKMQYIMIYVFIMSVVPTVSTEKHIIDELHIDGSSIVRPNYEDAYNGHELKLSWYKNQSFEVFDQNTLPQFTLAGYELDEHLLYYAEDIPPWSSLEVTFILQRQLGYYLLVFYVPCVLLVTVSFISFWLSYQATAARVSLNLTSALTVVAQGIGARFFLPRVSYTTALDVYIFASFCFVLGGLVEFAFANFLSRKCVVCKCRGNNIAIANNPKTEEPASIIH
uniref:Glycine receptor subunit alpha-1-like n=1 Tax=Saccoglossus kowalevskii TaxID=10224 RepID=A0ABM0LYF7_SACKO|nr:PREDICTED: glycine receptor subunit alpha-1-like [Saccoglossus kowalevskii]